ncbi:MAG: family 20 glycosylhydrolase [Fimbriimonadaceae bacterium]
MELRIWMLDVAREQSPTLDHLYQYAALTQEAGFDALGLYLEHRYAYPSAPWAHGKGCVTPAMVRSLQSEYPSLKVVPFINLLGHMEGFIYTEEGKRFREEPLAGMQACPCNPEFVALAERLLDDTLEAFTSDLVHIGGDETWQLGKCEKCAAFDKAELYGRHFGPLAARVVAAGRTPAVWGDMFLEHPTALDHLPKETVIFDWQYFKGVAETAAGFAGFRVVGCPTLHVYNAAWCHLPQSEENVRQVFRDSQMLHGCCLTTWECGLMGAYDTLFPALRCAGALSRDPDGPGFLEAYSAVSDRHGEWAHLMGVDLNEVGGVFSFSGHRNKLKSRVLLYANPFLAWMHHGEELSGGGGDAALSIVERAEFVAPGEAEKGVCTAVRGMVEFVRLASDAAAAYADGRPEEAIAKLTATRTVFDLLARAAKRTHERTGGSLADIERCKRAARHVDDVIVRLRDFGRGELGYLPAWEVLTHPTFVPHDQACWWLVNKWGRE